MNNNPNVFISWAITIKMKFTLFSILHWRILLMMVYPYQKHQLCMSIFVLSQRRDILSRRLFFRKLYICYHESTNSSSDWKVEKAEDCQREKTISLTSLFNVSLFPSSHKWIHINKIFAMIKKLNLLKEKFWFLFTIIHYL